MQILFSMFLLGILLGFVGAGGAGLVISVLTSVFGIPIHMALGTSLGAMIFTTASGAASHFREKNLAIKEGLIIGAGGGIGALSGVRFAATLPPTQLTRFTALMLCFCSVLTLLRLVFGFKKPVEGNGTDRARFLITGSVLGLVCGALSGAFGIGAAPFIQFGLLFFFGLSVHQVAGTTMLVTMPIAFMGGIGYFTAGYLDLTLFAKVVSGLMTGSFIGSKITRRAPPLVLKAAMVVLPIIAATLLFMGL